jgi:hypothetical protein
MPLRSLMPATARFDALPMSVPLPPTQAPSARHDYNSWIAAELPVADALAETVRRSKNPEGFAGAAIHGSA